MISVKFNDIDQQHKDGIITWVFNTYLKNLIWKNDLREK